MTLTPDETVLQLAMFMQARDARQWGVNTDGTYTPSWEDVGMFAQEEYINDATAFLDAASALGYVPAETALRVAQDTASAALHAFAERLPTYAIDFSTPAATINHIVSLLNRDADADRTGWPA